MQIPTLFKFAFVSRVVCLSFTPTYALKVARNPLPRLYAYLAGSCLLIAFGFPVSSCLSLRQSMYRLY
ncbi:hypothetical protein H206_06258 [Candidatus Electrothrix aarhusensis]|uniref:Uncharacterized protein n=1 Tax=Candidatus Electrothrix aarhusensis TaxID=1859131 RepID=A0A3S3R124_9BACT|nr:hypothetical protein H206_06258 [Candidatus Electrothrix aarhusensis]